MLPKEAWQSAGHVQRNWPSQRQKKKKIKSSCYTIDAAKKDNALLHLPFGVLKRRISAKAERISDFEVVLPLRFLKRSASLDF